MVENTKSALAAFSSPGSLPLPAPGGGGLRLEAVMENLQRQQAARLAREEKLRRGQAEPGPGQLRSVLGSRIQQYQAAVRCGLAPRGRLGGSPPGPGAPEHAEEEGDLEEEAGAARCPEPARSPSPPRQHHEWTYEEQFKQLYELDDDPKRKEFLDDLFGFMQKRDDRQETALNLSTNGISSINMSIEINGVVYTGVLFARRPLVPGAPGSNSSRSSHSRSSPVPAQNQRLLASSRSHTPTSASP
ncbi:LOW QUALITY PROTEIN: AT-rich interactive domain-containing protein 3C [Pangshura tecta]